MLSKGNHSIQIIDGSGDEAWNRSNIQLGKVMHLVLVGDFVWISVPNLEHYFVKS